MCGKNHDIQEENALWHLKIWNMEPEEHDEETPPAEELATDLIIVAGAIGAVLVLAICVLGSLCAVVSPTPGCRAGN